MNDPMTLLKRDHREVKAMLKDLAETDPGTKRNEMLMQIEQDLALHMEIEERLIYPAVQETQGEETREEADTEHDLARDGLVKVRELVDAPGFGAAIEMLLAGLTHHIKEEENEILPTLKKDMSTEDWRRLGDEVAAAKGESVAA